ncbi:hypothetical protein SBOR_5364 [Sclerotinia borealis F-4128]|uniref:Cytochrome P450 n=1 Tax=Sclerotinia borealis (strain F-4128) TaxID=1432307 RepID=W9CI65_SCLBF|nr:hypothetical protein SBOR_5364 [Sclerotinia borealis F-4128]
MAKLELMRELSTLHWLSGSAIAVVLSIFTWAFSRLKLHPLAAIPGPPHWILSRLPFAWALRQGEFVHRIASLHQEYGPVVRVASNEVSFADERAWDAFYAPYRKTSYLPKSPYCRAWTFSWGIRACFHREIMREHEPMILQNADILISQLKTEASKNAPVDIVDWFEYAAFDIVGDLAFSKSFHSMEDNEFHYLVNALRRVLHAFTQAVVPRILGLEMIWTWIVPRVSRQKQMAYHKSLNYFTHQRQAQGETPGKKDLMTYFTDRGDGKGLSIAETENAIGDIMIAGSETVASTLAAICYHIVRNSEAYRLLTTEIRQSFDREQSIIASAVAELLCLNAVMDEAMRLCPSLPMVMPRMVTEPGMEVCGHWLPSGTLVTFCQLAAYTSPTNFASPKEFIPERWLPDSQIKPHNTNVYHPFSVGPRDCVGKAFGFAEVRLILAKLIWNFDLSLGEKDWDWYTQKAFLEDLGTDVMVRIQSAVSIGDEVYALTVPAEIFQIEKLSLGNPLIEILALAYWMDNAHQIVIICDQLDPLKFYRQFQNADKRQAIERGGADNDYKSQKLTRMLLSTTSSYTATVLADKSKNGSTTSHIPIVSGDAEPLELYDIPSHEPDAAHLAIRQGKSWSVEGSNE